MAAKPESYDLAVVGGGPGGYVAAIRAGQLALKTILIEEAKVGGVCLHVGCIPSKAIISAAKDYRHAAKGPERGLHTTATGVDMPKLVSWKQSVVDRLATGVAALLKANKVETVAGRATLTGPHQIEVQGPAGKRQVEAKNILLATGSSTIEIPGFKVDERHIVSSTGALAPASLPRHLAVIGGGVIGLELGCAYANLGSKVTVIEMMDQLVPGVDAEVAKGLERILKRRGFEIHLGARAKEAKVTGDVVKLAFEVQGQAQSVECDLVLVAVGRRPNSRNLGLEKAGVKVDERGFVPTDAQKRTNVPSIYAVGDLTLGPMLAHKASKEGIVAVEAMAGLPSAADFAAIPGVIFTDPEVATAGLTEAQAKAAGHDVKVATFPMAALGRALAAG
ncbi:MAG: dihydrolipoyl dehydrogenase, partial [Thermoplasmatota archaeon]